MKCPQARKTIEQVDADSSPLQDESLVDHLKGCRECASYFQECERIWQVMGAYPSVEPSPDFAARLYRKIAEPHHKERSSRGWFPITAWQWAAMGACVLALGIFLAFHFARVPADLETKLNKTDVQDERFLQDLDQDLQQTNEDYLQVFDSWPASTSDVPSTDQLQRGHARNPKDRGKSSS